MRSGRVGIDWSRFRDETAHASVGMMLERVWPMDTTVGILVKWEVTSATVLVHVVKMNGMELTGRTWEMDGCLTREGHLLLIRVREACARERK
jgi:hypothetical protein